MKTVDPNRIKRIGSGRSLRALMGASLLFGGCSSGQVIIQESSIPPGLYIGERECSSTINGVEDLTLDSSRITIDNNGLLVLNGETIHVGLVNTFETGTFTQRGVIEAIAVSADGFTIDWDITFLFSGGSLDGFVLESFKTVGTNTIEVRETLLASTEGLSFSQECVAVLSR